jgi:glycine cleavage system aminomethyltransferase T
VLADGSVVGTLSSRVVSPVYGPIGLAMLATEVAVDGRALQVVTLSGAVPATVAPLSVKDPDKTRPRG